MHPHGAQNSHRALRLILEGVWRADQRQMLACRINSRDTNLHEHGIRGVDAPGQQRNQPMFFFDRHQDFAQLRLIGELMRCRHLRGALDVDSLRRALLQHAGVAKNQGVARQKIVALLLARQTGGKIRANRLQRAANIRVDD